MTISDLVEERSILATENRYLRDRVDFLEAELQELEEMVFVLSRKILEIMRQAN